MQPRVTVGVVGYGYWGPNVVRNFNEVERVDVKYVCDLRADQLDRGRLRYRTVRFTDNFEELLNDPHLDAISITTPVDSHFALAKRALLARKHVLIAKPMCKTSAECQELIALAAELNLILMVDHTFVYHGPVRLIKQLLDKGELGQLLYLTSLRVNLGIFQHDVNVVWDLGVHDLAILDYLLGQQMPKSVHAIGKAHTDSGLEDIAFMTLEFENDLIAHFNLSWLSPVKIRQMLIGGTKKMLTFDDHRPIDKVCIYDKGIEPLDHTNQADKERYKALVQYRYGDMRAPVYEMTEALKYELLHFVDCVLNNKQPLTDGSSGLRVVRILEMADESLKTQKLKASSISLNG